VVTRKGSGSYLGGTISFPERGNLNFSFEAKESYFWIGCYMFLLIDYV